MILLEEKADKTGPSSSSLSAPSHYASAGYYANTDYAPSSSGGSASLRPPPQWPASASETALPLAGSPPVSASSFPPLSATHSHTYIPVAVKQPVASFTRPAPINLERTPFQPMFLFADGNSLGNGFPNVLPPSTNQPHPFFVHDINETDWTTFLGDMQRAARLTEKDTRTAYCVPVVSSIPIINLALASAITHHIRRKKPRLVSLLVDKWNHHFFHPRNIEVILMRGQVKLSGQSDQPVANLYTPRTVNFKPPLLEDATSDGKSPPAAKGGSARGHGSGNADKTYRLFVVSMEA
ncbi:hypothetical protein DFH08DRAFT_848111 [Mycena albidolilacea]|uniref:Uncharacterized protein n=1 Tax=Mycena albidolilacea TaxID=1033008 RepID=A0AAD7F047_9AGAR|nr:hypothetical protein DFH08DRAFT_848111 [Mycena albidolilacea]